MSESEFPALAQSIQRAREELGVALDYLRNRVPDETQRLQAVVELAHDFWVEYQQTHTTTKALVDERAEKFQAAYLMLAEHKTPIDDLEERIERLESVVIAAGRLLRQLGVELVNVPHPFDRRTEPGLLELRAAYLAADGQTLFKEAYNDEKHSKGTG